MGPIIKTRRKNLANALIIEGFFIAFFLVRLFCADTTWMTDSYVAAIKFPFIDCNTSILHITIPLVALGLLILFSGIRLDRKCFFFLLRVGLYFIPLLYLPSEIQSKIFRGNTAYSIFQTMVAFYLGYNYRGEFKNIIRILFFASLIVVFQIVFTLFASQVSPFDVEALKYYMRIPLGQTNYLSAFLIVCSILVNCFCKGKIKWYYILAYNAVIVFGIFSTASRSGLLIIGVYYLYEFIVYIKNSNIFSDKKFRKKFFIVCGIVALLVVVAVIVLWGKLYPIIRRFNFNSLTENRLIIYRKVLQEYIFKYPLLGISAYSYQVHDAVMAHNFLLESLVQSGILGTIPYIILIVWVFKDFLRIEDKQLKNLFILYFCLTFIHGSVEPNLFTLSTDTMVWFLFGTGVRMSKPSKYKIEKNVKKVESDNSSKLSVIIVSYKNIEILRDCLNSIKEYNDIGDRLEVIVSDNSEDNLLYDTIKAEYDWIKIIKNKNEGFGAGNNRGYEVSTGEYLLFLNPDTILIEPVFDYAIKKFEENKYLGLFGVKLVDKNRNNLPSFFLMDTYGIYSTLYSKAHRALGLYNDDEFFISGADLFVRRSSFEQAGKFDENIFMYKEEGDLIKRIGQCAEASEVKYFRSKKIIHLEGGTEDKTPETRLKLVTRIVETEKYYCKKWKMSLVKTLKEKRRYERLRMFIYKLTKKSSKIESQRKVIDFYTSEIQKAKAGE